MQSRLVYNQRHQFRQIWTSISEGVSPFMKILVQVDDIRFDQFCVPPVAPELQQPHKLQHSQVQNLHPPIVEEINIQMEVAAQLAALHQNQPAHRLTRIQEFLI